MHYFLIMKNFFLIFISVLILTSCKVEPKEINFGFDTCHFCRMTIVDKPFAAEIVNSKGKLYVYDAIECMIKNDFTENLDASLYLVFDYQNTDQFINASTSYYVISKKIKSPMGENLAAFENYNKAEEFVKLNEGMLFNWEEINAYFKTDGK